MTIPHVPSNPERIAYASEQNALIYQCNATTTQTGQQQAALDSHASTLAGHGGRLDALETAPPAHTHPIDQVTGLQGALDGKASTSHTHALAFDALTDVDTTSTAPVSGQVLKWNGSMWAPANDATADPGSGGVTTLDGLDDVAITSPASGQVLVYNGTTWINTSAPASTGAYRGEWTDANNGAGTTITNTGSGSPGDRGVKVTDIGVAVGTPVGCSMSAGTFTAQRAGRWLLQTSVQYQGNNTAQRAVYLAASAAADSPATARNGVNGGPSMDAQAASWVFTLPVGGQVSVYVACWMASASVRIHRALSNNLVATWLGP